MSAEATGTAPLAAFVILGLVAGGLSGIFGVGGGALVLLGLAALYGVPVREGLPVALALNVTNALFGFATHARAGRVLWQEIHVLLPSAVFGIALGVSTKFVFLFVLFGALLDKAGAGNYFIKMAFGALGHLRGGPAKAAVVGSAATGLISGSSIANEFRAVSMASLSEAK